MSKESTKQLELEPLIQDQYAGAPSKRALAYVQSKREQGKHVVGAYCGYAPFELIRAMDAVPAVLCAFANTTIEAAEAVLPGNLCPLIKSSYGYIITDTCPFFSLSEAVVAETTCDGKKKMFELIADRKPMFVMDLPQMPDEDEAKRNWAVVIGKLKAFLEKTFKTDIKDSAIETAIRDTNSKNTMMDSIFEYAACTPPYISWQEMYDLTFLAQPSSFTDIEPLLKSCMDTLEKRKKNATGIGKENAPRILITGCPVGGDAAKVFKVIEEAGGVIVAIDNCTGMKTFLDTIEEGTKDPIQALADRYLKLPCSCMSPNTRRIEQLDRLIERFRPDAVIDVILHACHSYNIESYKVGEHVKNTHKLPFLKIETDYSDGDVRQIRTRVEALFEMM
jgi:benzoyl-CoA reductase/2-hydroxyglutaryl-CoA dehydratase subunit BcrC/BadD/HgdB